MLLAVCLVACTNIDDLKKLFEFNPATIGGSMPDDDFYYFAN